MNELNQSGDINQVANKIYEEMSSADRSITRIVTYLQDLQTKEEYQSLSNSEFYDIVGETFKLNPSIFMKHIYEKFWQYKNKSEMEKYILEKYCLYDGEQILFEGSGKTIQELPGGGRNSVSGTIYVTNFRIIGQGKLSSIKGVPFDDWIDVVISPFRGHRDKKKSKDELIEGSTYQELPCYGYQFKTKNRSGVKKKKDGIKYSVNREEKKIRFSDFKKYMMGHRSVRITLTHPDRAQINNLFEVLCIDINQIMNVIRELLDMELDQKRKEWAVLGELHPRVFKSEGIHHFSASDYLYIVEETYKLDPEFFMTSIYPKMMSWKYAKYISEIDVKWEINTLVNKLNKESGI